MSKHICEKPLIIRINLPISDIRLKSRTRNIFRLCEVKKKISSRNLGNWIVPFLSKQRFFSQLCAMVLLCENRVSTYHNNELWIKCENFDRRSKYSFYFQLGEMYQEQKFKAEPLIITRTHNQPNYLNQLWWNFDWIVLY